MKPDPSHTPNTNSNSKWSSGLNVRAKTRKLLEENIGLNLHDLGFDNGFLHATPKAQTAKERK